MRELYVGVMSGTSLDAVDAVAVSIDANSISLISSYSHPFPGPLRRHILNICTGQSTTLPEVGRIDHELGKLYASVVNTLLKQSKLKPNQVRAIGNHGQTVFHQPVGESRFTMQLGDANLIAALTGIDTIADFRRLDMAVGGQGAPLAPAFHQFVFGQQNITTAVLNIGGIANITVLPMAGPVTGFDTGPGNMLMDSWCEKHTGQPFDKDAQLARQGSTNLALLDQLMSDSFLARTPPKTTGREYFNLAWLEPKISSKLAVADVQRTLCEFTALSIAEQVEPLGEQPQNELLVCGGGANNPLLMERIKQHLQKWQILPTADRGVHGDDMEAMAFAWLARQRIHNKPSNLPGVTGASRQVSLGVIHQSTQTINE